MGKREPIRSSSQLSRLFASGRDYSKNCKKCGKMYSASTEQATEKRRTCPKCGGDLDSPNWK